MYWDQYQMIVNHLTQVFCDNLEQQFILHSRHQIILNFLWCTIIVNDCQQKALDTTR